jgi:curved DNA-binding protein CbpA
MAQDNLYQKLGVSPSATAEEIHHAYAALSQELLPELVLQPSGGTTTATTQVTEDEKLFRELTSAYRTLIDEESRRHYDQSLQHGAELAFQLVEHKEAVPEHHQVARYQEVILPQHEPTETWRKEREHFEEHFEEILKPAPKVNLIEPSGAVVSDGAAVLSGAEANEDAFLSEEPVVDISVRFGTVASEKELASLEGIKHARRPMSLSIDIDPFHVLLLLGLPFLAIVLLVEFYILMP